MGFLDEGFHDYGLEMVFKKNADEAFRIPVDNIGSATISEAAWRSADAEEEIVVSPVLPVDPEALFARLPLRGLHTVYWSRVRRLLFSRIKRAR